jgi:hypothetical protein
MKTSEQLTDLMIALVVWQSSIDRFLFTWADCCFQ